MPLTDELHDRAMEQVDIAIAARRQGRADDANDRFRQALQLEKQAIAEYVGPKGLTWALLHRSAAFLALDCGEYRQAEKLAASALSGDPPAAVAEELRDALEKSNFDRHLALRGLKLGDDEIQVSLSGSRAAGGFVFAEEYTQRIGDCKKLLLRIAERLNGITFRSPRQRPRKEIVDFYPLLLSESRAGSYAVTMRIAGLQHQLPMRGFPQKLVEPHMVVTEFMDLMAHFEKADRGQIDRAIKDDAYADNFVALAKNIAPDGAKVKQVGLTSNVKGVVRKVPVTLPRSAARERLIGRQTNHGDGSDAAVAVKGLLHFADSMRRSDSEIRLLLEDGDFQRIGVDPSLMDDIVRPLWGLPVMVNGIRKGNWIRLTEIEALEDATVEAPQTPSDLPAT